MNRLTLCAFCLMGISVCSADDWPQWRGPDRSDISNETGLLQSWPADGPKRAWMSKEGGLGYSGFSVVGNNVFTMGLEIDGDKEFIVCLNAKDGSTNWKTNIAEKFSNRWGDGPRATPTIDEGHCYAMSGNGTIACLSLTGGKEIWKKKMSDFGGRVPFWGYCESVLIDGDNLICTPGGKQGAILALNKKTGETVWQSTDFTEGAQYSSIIKATINQTPQYIQLTQRALVAVSPKDGSVIWKSDWRGQTAVIPTPIVRDNMIYISSGYNAGCKVVKISEDNKPTDVWQNKVMVNHHGGVILKGDYLYGYCDGRRGGWTCQDLKSGEAVWNDSKKLGKGAIAYADGKFYCLSEQKGEVVLIDASKDGWKENGRFTLTPQTENRSPSGKIWVHPVIANGKMYLRDQELIYCYDVAK